MSNAYPKPCLSIRSALFHGKACLSIFRIRLTQGVQYRLSALSGAAVSIFYALIEITVTRVFFLYGANAGLSGVGNGMSLPQAAGYIWLGQFLAIIMMQGVDKEILQKIDSGDVGLELCRPLGLYGHWFAKSAAGSLAPLLFRGVPVLLAGFLAPAPYRLGLPASLPDLFCAGITSVTAVLLITAFTTLVAAIRLNVNWGDGPMSMLLLLSQLLSGVYLPLKLWPDFMQKALTLQPFAGYADLPLRFYLGLLPPADAGRVLLLQGFWIIVFLFAGRTLMKRRLRGIIVQGG